MITAEQLAAELRQRMVANHQPVRASRFDGQPYAHPRGWNDALEFVEKCIKEVLGEKP